MGVPVVMLTPSLCSFASITTGYTNGRLSGVTSADAIRKTRLISCFLTEEELGVAVGEEAEVVFQRVVIHAPPLVLAYKGCYK